MRRSQSEKFSGCLPQTTSSTRFYCAYMSLIPRPGTAVIGSAISSCAKAAILTRTVVRPAQKRCTRCAFVQHEAASILSGLCSFPCTDLSLIPSGIPALDSPPFFVIRKRRRHRDQVRSVYVSVLLRGRCHLIHILKVSSHALFSTWFVQGLAISLSDPPRPRYACAACVLTKCYSRRRRSHRNLLCLLCRLLSLVLATQQCPWPVVCCRIRLLA